MDQREFRRLLKTHFESLSKKNPKFSMRAFASRVGLGIGAVSEIMAGKRKVSRESGRKIIDNLKLNERDKLRFEAALSAGDVHERTSAKGEGVFLLEHWSYLAILCLFETDLPVKTSADILSRLKLNENELKGILKKLTDAGYVRLNEEGVLESTRKAWSFGDGPPSATIRRFHKDSLQLSLDALESVAVKERDFASLTFAGARDRLEPTRQVIRKSLDRVVESMSRGESDAVYRVSVQLIPLTQKDD